MQNFKEIVLFPTRQFFLILHFLYKTVQYWGLIRFKRAIRFMVSDEATQTNIGYSGTIHPQHSGKVKVKGAFFDKN